MNTRSIPYLVLLCVLTLGLGGMLWMVFGEVLSPIFAQPTFEPAVSDVETPGLADGWRASHRNMRLLWGVFPVIIVVAVAVTALIKARSGPRGR